MVVPEQRHVCDLVFQCSLFFFFLLVHIQFCRQTATDKHALHKAAKCRERLFPCPRDGNFSIFTAGPVALAASCHVIPLSPRGLDQTPVVSRLCAGGQEGVRGGMEVEGVVVGGGWAWISH